MTQRPSNILLVEDNAVDAALIQEMLRREGGDNVNVHAVESLAEARQALSEGAYHLALLDLGLPDSCGLLTLEKLLLCAAPPPVIILTGNVNDEDAVRAVGMGAQDYLYKPEVNAKQLLRAVRFAIERRKSQSLLSWPALSSDSTTPPPVDLGLGGVGVDDTVQAHVSAAGMVATEYPVYGGNYSAERVVGQGGMGVVYAGRDLSLNRPVAIKVLHLMRGASERDELRFSREARLLATLEHPGIVPIYAYGVERGQHYFVMKYIQGTTLGDRLAGTRRELAVLLQELRPVFEALDYAHDRGVIHRDIKPGNIVFDENGSAVLLDFGVAEYTEHERLTHDGSVVGTPAYMSPEQALGNEALTGASDQYAVGVMFYKLLTGEAPFHADTNVALVYQHVHEQPTSLRELNADLSQAMEDAVLRALHKEPAQRHPDLQSMFGALRDALEPGLMVPPSSAKDVFDSGWSSRQSTSGEGSTSNVSYADLLGLVADLKAPDDESAQRRLVRFARAIQTDPSLAVYRLPPEASKEVQTALKDACRLTGELGDDTSRSILRQLLRGVVLPVVAKRGAGDAPVLWEAFGWVSAPGDLGTWRLAASDPDERHREAAVRRLPAVFQALSGAGSASAAEELIQLMFYAVEDDSPPVQVAAQCALARIGSAQVVPIILRRLEGGLERRYRVELLEALLVLWERRVELTGDLEETVARELRALSDSEASPNEAESPVQKLAARFERLTGRRP